MRTGIGSVEPVWPDVRRIAVLRGGGLGDLVFAMPAFEALDAAYPDAEIVLLGVPGFAELLADRPGPVDRVVTLPPAKGVYEVDGPCDWDGFARAVGPIDLGVQLHGGGRNSNPFLLRLAPRWTVGACTPDAAELTRWLPYRYYQNEVMRALEIVGLAGAAPVSVVPRLAVTPRDLANAAAALDGLPEPLLTIHPGATDPRRRWPAERFAEIAAAVAAGGAGVAVVGSPAERDLVGKVAALAGAPSVWPLADLDLAGLCGVLAASRVVLANDSGPRHIAEAVGTATVGVFWLGNALNAGSLGRGNHRVLLSWTTRCPECGVDCTREDVPRCEHDVSFVAGVPVADAMREVVDLLD
ncbi:glycosyltransferase family 9 protein [Actinophytocola glycyrrhizae]|uniref:Glycosyltransferase family 9 protein n=1 Tax=Actinophytocola glycyrrhizae TaxID=2044873 RepID=A0ABV9RX79_9PSEU